MTKERIICPNCGASYRITVKMLQQAGQEARCAVCKQVFTINVQDVEFSPDNPDLSAENVIKQLRASGRRERNRKKNEAKETHKNQTGQQAQTEQKKKKERAPTFSVVQPGDTTIPRAPRVEADDETAQQTVPDKPLPEQAPAGKPTDAKSANESAHHRILTGHAKPPPGSKQPAALWLAGSVLLSLTLIAQASWLMREQPIVYRNMVKACEVIGCKPPELRNPKAISIADRLFTAVEDRPGTYQLQLNLRNHAPYPQPFPTIELSLLDNNGVVQARNRFVVDDYLAENAERMLQPGLVTGIEFMVRTPTVDTTGFMLDFL